MESLIVVLIILFIVLTNEKSKQKKRGAAPAKPQRAARGRESFRQRLEKLKAEAEKQLQAVEEAVPDGSLPDGSLPDAASVLQPEIAQGVSLHDDEGCVGGSMEHVHTEGETHAEHRRHVEALRRRETEERLAAQAAAELAALNTQKLRQAVIMKELLDRPVALRGRRGIRQ